MHKGDMNLIRNNLYFGGIMDIFSRILWFVVTGLAYGAVFCLWQPLFKKWRWWWSLVRVLSGIALVIGFAYLSITFYGTLPMLLRRLLFVLYVVFLADASTEMILLPVRFIQRDGAKWLTRLLAGLLVSLGFLGYMMANAQGTLTWYSACFTAEGAEESAKTSSAAMGSAIFLHCSGSTNPFTGGCVAIPENRMRTALWHVRPDCVVVINTKQALEGR